MEAGTRLEASTLAPNDGIDTPPAPAFTTTARTRAPLPPLPRYILKQRVRMFTRVPAECVNDIGAAFAEPARRSGIRD